MRACLAALAAIATLVVTGSASAVSDTYNGATFHPFTMPGNTGCVAWSDPAEGTTHNCDPVNLVFPNQSWTRVRDRLRARGWTTWGFGSTQYLHFETTTLVAQHAQLFRSDGFGRQYHIRLWQTGATTVAGVHHESGVFSHTIDRGWEEAEVLVRTQLCPSAPASCSSAPLPQQAAMQAAVGGGPLWRGWTNDSAATVIP